MTISINIIYLPKKK